MLSVGLSLPRAVRRWPIMLLIVVTMVAAYVVRERAITETDE
jgi:hypothetical protein